MSRSHRQSSKLYSLRESAKIRRPQRLWVPTTFKLKIWDDNSHYIFKVNLCGRYINFLRFVSVQLMINQRA